MTPTGNTGERPTRRQLSYLKSLATRTGHTFVWPKTRSEASREIGRLKALPPADDLPAELDVEAERAAREANSDVPVQDFEVAGFGSNCRRSH
jgi:hypothetical protein